jgi:hypothetical protein
MLDYNFQSEILLLPETLTLNSYIKNRILKSTFSEENPSELQ